MTRRFQFSLKWLFVAMLVMAAFFGGIGTEMRRVGEELAKERAALEKRGAALAREELSIRFIGSQLAKERARMFDVSKPPGFILLPPICGTAREVDQQTAVQP